MFKLLGAFCILVTCGLAAKYPSDLPKCHYGDVDCIKNAIGYILPLAKNGLPGLNIVPLNPIEIKQIALVQDGNGPVTLKTNINNAKIFGVESFRINKIVGFGKNIEQSKFELYGDIPIMSVIGDYDMSGRILILPITGNGKINVTSLNSAFSMKLQPKVLEKNGKKFLQIKKIIYRAEPGKVIINLTNLFGGDEQLGRTMNEFLNQNWSEIYSEMRDVIEAAIGKIILGLINNVFAKVEYSELFINE